MKTNLHWGWRVVAAFLCAVFAGPWLVRGADVTPGYTFASGEQNVTHTKLNNASAGTVNTTFYSSRAAAPADPSATAYYLLLHDSGNNVFKKATLNAAIFDHTTLLNGRTAKTAPVAGDYVLIADSEAGNAYKKTTIANLAWGGSAVTSVTNNDRIPVLRAVDTNIGTMTVTQLLSGWSAAGAIVTNDLLLLVSPTNGIRMLPLVQLSQLFREQYVLLQERTNGSVALPGAIGVYTNRSLNTLEVDTGGNCVLSNNANFWLLAGTYRFRASAPGYRADLHNVRLVNASQSATVALGTMAFSGTSDATETRSEVVGRMTITSNCLFRLEHMCIGNFGQTWGFAPGTLSNIVAKAEFWKEPGP
jgi:hypothetical protein